MLAKRRNTIKKYKKKEFKTAFTMRSLFRLFAFCPLVFFSFFLSCCLFFLFSFCFFVLLSFCFFVFLSGHHSDQMSEGSQVSKVNLCVQILK